MEKIIKINNNEEAKILFGKNDEHLRIVESELGVTIVARGEELKIIGEEKNVYKAKRVFEELLLTIRGGGVIRKNDIGYALKAISDDSAVDLHSIYLNKILVPSKRQFVTPRTKGQKDYIDAIKTYDIVFGIGPAGTGKTYLAVAMAVNALKKQIVSRIVLTRPAVEAGENLGYLPGGISEKVAPYLRPLYDALYDMIDIDKVQELVAKGIIETVPLAYMRGRTLNDAFVILDEAQNSTPEQMKMFLTRLGFDSKTVITGDITQIDLPHHQVSGLVQVKDILKDIDGIKFVYFSKEDVVRHELVHKIIRAYEVFESEQKHGRKNF